MGSPFDELAKQTFTTVTNLHGVDAVWHSSKRRRDTGTVLYKCPTEALKVGDTEGYEYKPDFHTAEFFYDVFPGLKDAVKKGDTPQYLTLKGQKFLIIDVETRYDGNTIVAHLEPSE